MARNFCSTLGLALLAGVVLGGCGIRGNPTPELHSYGASFEQKQNDRARIVDNNIRQIWDDLDRVFLLDQTSRLTRFPVP